jgi:hypothetical protein
VAFPQGFLSLAGRIEADYYLGNMRRFTVILALLLFPAPLLNVQVSKPDLQVSTATGQTTFRMGERIPLVFTFTGLSDKSLTISLRNYDRSGRLTLEDFAVSPATGWTDPLAQFF